MIEIHVWGGEYGHAALTIQTPERTEYISFHANYSEDQQAKAVTFGVQADTTMTDYTDDVRHMRREQENAPLQLHNLNDAAALMIWDAIRDRRYNIYSNNCSDVCGLLLVGAWMGTTYIFRQDHTRLLDEVQNFKKRFGEEKLRIGVDRYYRYNDETIDPPGKPVGLYGEVMLNGFKVLFGDKNKRKDNAIAMAKLLAGRVGSKSVWNPKMVHGLGIHFSNGRHACPLFVQDIELMQNMEKNGSFVAHDPGSKAQQEYPLRYKTIWEAIGEADYNTALDGIIHDLYCHPYALVGNGWRWELYFALGHMYQKRREASTAKYYYGMSKAYLELAGIQDDYWSEYRDMQSYIDNGL
jgi:hypothetical protein